MRLCRLIPPVSSAISLAFALALFIALPSASSAASQPDLVGLETRTQNLLLTELNNYATTYGSYGAGVWRSDNDVCWPCNEGGPATAAATAFVVGGASDTHLLAVAIDTLNAAIAHHQRSDGAFDNPIWTYFFGVELGTTYHLLEPYLAPETRSRWRSSLEAAADYLETSGNATFYINGNINLGFAELFFLVWDATKKAEYLTDYNNEWSYLEAPPQSRFPGAGLVITKQPTEADGADGAGYLAEIGPSATGFDPEYTELQLDEASRLYLLSGDPRALRLANLEINQLTPLVSQDEAQGGLVLNDSNGTRYEYKDHPIGFLDSAYAVLALFGGRSDLSADIGPELSGEALQYSWGQENPTYIRALGNDLSVQALAEWMAANGRTVVNQIRPAPIQLKRGVNARAWLDSDRCHADTYPLVRTPSWIASIPVSKVGPCHP